MVATGISLFCFGRYGTLDADAVLATLSITFSQILFVGIGVFIAVFIPKIRTTTTITATVGLLAFTAEVFINALHIRWLEFCSPLHFFTPKSVFESGGYDVTLVLYAVVILLASVGLSALRYVKSDLTKL